MPLLPTAALGLLSGCSASPPYRFCPLLPRMKLSADRFDTDISRKSELWDHAAQLKHLWRRGTPGGRQRSAVVGRLHRCSGSGWSTQPPSESSLSHFRAVLVVFRVNVLFGGERSAQLEVLNPGLAFRCFQASFTGRRFCLNTQP